MPRSEQVPALDTLVFGHRLRHFRKQRGLTLAQLGAQIGRPASYLSMLETARREPRLSVITPAEGPSVFEQVAVLRRIKITQEGSDLIPTTCSKNAAELILNSLAFRQPSARPSQKTNGPPRASSTRLIVTQERIMARGPRPSP